MRTDITVAIMIEVRAWQAKIITLKQDETVKLKMLSFKVEEGTRLIATIKAHSR